MVLQVNYQGASAAWRGVTLSLPLPFTTRSSRGALNDMLTVHVVTRR